MHSHELVHKGPLRTSYIHSYEKDNIIKIFKKKSKIYEANRFIHIVLHGTIL